MPIHFVCPHCAAKTDLPDRFAGLMGPCAHCGNPVTIPPVGGQAAPTAHKATTTATILLIAVLGAGVLGAAALAALVIPLYSANRDVADRAMCAHNLKQIAFALRQYESVYGSFPPAYVADKEGKPLYSWRVLLLPFLGQTDLHDRFRLDEPWNSTNNRRVTDLGIGLFQCPAQPPDRDPVTNYMMVVGPHTISNGAGATKIADITDGLKNTIMVVEVADSSVWWAEPEDLGFDHLDFGINAGKRQVISSYHSGGANAAFCDESVRFLKNAMNPQLVKSMLTIDENEQIPAD